jgi:hypothetical protein
MPACNERFYESGGVCPQTVLCEFSGASPARTFVSPRLHKAATPMYKIREADFVHRGARFACRCAFRFADFAHQPLCEIAGVGWLRPPPPPLRKAGPPVCASGRQCGGQNRESLKTCDNGGKTCEAVRAGKNF